MIASVTDVGIPKVSSRLVRPIEAGVVNERGATGAITSNGVSSKLYNEDSTISGSGTIGDSHLSLVNDATIKASIASDVILIDTAIHINHGTLLAQARGHLQVELPSATLGQRFRGSNHIRRPRRVCKTMWRPAAVSSTLMRIAMVLGLVARQRHQPSLGLRC